MKAIKEFAKKPELIEIKLNDQDILDIYGEEVSFWMKDHIDLGTYFDFYKFQRDSSDENLMNTLRRLILTAEGKPAITEEEVLPIDLTLAVMVKINEHLGKSKTRLSQKEVGTQP